MREIKFRAWDVFYNCWFKWEFAIAPDGKVYEIAGDEIIGIREGVEVLKLTQYTGIKDKDGREIYEGDIISFSERSINGFVSTHVCRVFQSENGAWRVEGHPDFDTSYKTRRELYLIRNFCEVVGNIHETPELMKEEIS